MSDYRALRQPHQDFIDLDIVDYEEDRYHVEYELYDDAPIRGIRFRSDYRITAITKNDVDLDPMALDPYPRQRIELAIQSKHGSAISGI